jgi:hypothetical protein
MAGTMSTEEFQKQTLEFLKAQQDAYLEAVKSWREAASSGMAPPPAPEWPKVPDLGDIPNMDEVAGASYAFAAKLLAEQSRFMEALGKAMAGPKGKR